jgi:hypothetical protein
MIIFSILFLVILLQLKLLKYFLSYYWYYCIFYFIFKSNNIFIEFIILIVMFFIIYHTFKSLSYKLLKMEYFLNLKYKGRLIFNIWVFKNLNIILISSSWLVTILIFWKII